MQRSQQQLLGAEHRARLPSLFAGDFNEVLGVRGISQSVTGDPGPSATTAGRETALDLLQIQSEPGENCAGLRGAQEREKDVLRSHGVVTQAFGFTPGVFQNPLGARTQGVRVHSGGRRCTQRGLASSISMIGMPSSTGYTR